jgi:hypothetical protein
MKSVFERISDFLCSSSGVVREARRMEAERKARVEQYSAAWREAHPDLVAKGVPPPPTAESMTLIGVRNSGGFYQP